MRRLRRIDWRDLAVIGGAVAVALILGWVVVTGHEQGRQINGLSTALEAQRKQAQEAGQTPVAKPPGEVKSNPAQPTVSPVPGPSGPGPSDAQVYAAVSAYFQAHPVHDGKSVSPGQLAASVANYLRKHPPSASSVAAAVAAYLTANPPPAGPSGAPGKDGADGKNGADGKPGPGPTAQQIADAVAQYITDHPLPTCPDGYSAQAEQVLTAAGPKDGLLCEKD